MNIFVIGGALGLAFVAYELLVAALTFAVAANVARFRSSAISAPIASVILAPCLLLIVFPFLLQHMFIARSGFRGWAVYSLAAVLIIIVCAVLAKAAALSCRAVFEFLPPWMNERLGLKPDLLVRSAILVGGSLSLLVVVAIFGWLSIVSGHHLERAFSSGAIGLIAAVACGRAMLLLRNPELFRPAPLPTSLKRMILRESSPSD